MSGVTGTKKFSRNIEAGAPKAPAFFCCDLDEVAGVLAGKHNHHLDEAGKHKIAHLV